MHRPRGNLKELEAVQPDSPAPRYFPCKESLRDGRPVRRPPTSWWPAPLPRLHLRVENSSAPRNSDSTRLEFNILMAGQQSAPEQLQPAWVSLTSHNCGVIPKPAFLPAGRGISRRNGLYAGRSFAAPEVPRSARDFGARLGRSANASSSAQDDALQEETALKFKLNRDPPLELWRCVMFWDAQ